MEASREINEEMTVLLRQLVMQDQIRIAGLTLKAYLIRQWNIDEKLALSYVHRFFYKYYPKQLEQHLKRLNRSS